MAALLLIALGGGAFVLFGTDRGRFEDARDLLTAIKSEVPCTDVKIFRGLDPGVYAGRCYVDGGDFELDVYVFDETTTRDAYLRNLVASYEHEVLVGPNWFLTTGDRPTTSEIQRVVGGDIRDPGP